PARGCGAGPARRDGRGRPDAGELSGRHSRAPAAHGGALVMKASSSALLAVVLLTASPALAQSFTDPVPYCRAVGTIDEPDARYGGPKLPGWMAAQLGLHPTHRN